MPTAVSQFPAAPSAAALAHFGALMAFETDCSDVHHALTTAAAADFVLLDVRSPSLFAAGHLPGAVNLPHGTGKTARVLVFANAAKAEEARAAGADFVGSDDMIEKVAGGWTDFDAAVATPDLMGKVGRLGKVLGPRGLMPNPKTGTVTMDVAKAVSDIKGGKIEFRVDKHSTLNFIIGKASFTEAALLENYRPKPKPTQKNDTAQTEVQTQVVGQAVLGRQRR